VYFTFNIPPPANIKNIFGNWLNRIDKCTKARIRVGVCAIMWAIWNHRNDVIFNRVGRAQFLQVIDPQGYVLDQYVGLSPIGRPAATYRFWMHTVDGGHLGYLQPGWLTAF
jgi:hypothetical protein